MSSTVKEQLAAAKRALDLVFANASASERPELIKDLRDYLSRANSASRTPLYDKHTNAASGV